MTRPPMARTARTRGRRPRSIVAAALAATLLTACSTSTHHTALDQQPPPSVSAVVPTAPLSLSTDYKTAVTDAVATTLKLPAPQISTDLSAQPDATLMTLAKPKGVAQDSLAATIRSALVDAAATQVRSGTWTPSQAAQLTTFWTAQTDPSLITRISQWFRGQ